MPRCALPAVLLLLAAGSLSAEPGGRVPLPGESAGTGRRLDAADKLAADKQYAAAAEEYVRISEEAGDDLVAVDAHLTVPARRLCHLRLAALPIDALRPYRTRVDPQAKKWLEQGTADHDPHLLQRVVDETFCSRRTDAALDLLGDLEFERGHFFEAGRWWRMLALPASEVAARAKRPLPAPWTRPADGPPNLDLLFPDPQIDVARARAKQVLALLFRGDKDEAGAELEAFRALHPKAEGQLAGRKGNYADILQAVAARPIPPELAEDAWPTFGGDPSRGAVLPAERSDPNRLNPLIKHGPAWRFTLGPLKEPVAALPSVTERARHLAFHPIIAGRQVLAADARSVTAFDSDSGAKQTWDLSRDGDRRVNVAEGLKVETTLPAPADLRYTLTTANGRVFARLGAQELTSAKTGAAADSYLVCLRLADPGQRLTAVWLREADPPGKGPRAIFEGAPVVRDGLLYVAASRFEGGGQMVTEVRCYSAGTGAGPRWKQDVLTTRDLPTTPRYRHQLLTLAGRHVVFASHAGAVIALDARTGRRAWAYRYPSAVVRTSGGNPVPRDLAPAVYAAGRLYVAPADYDRLLCLDPDSGQLLWERERLAVVHLLGVGSGRLIFTTPTGIRAVRAGDGDDVWQTTDISGTDGLPSYGRGFLAGQCVFWPTSSGVKVLSQDDGQVPIDYIPGPSEVRDHLRPGNLAYAGGILAVADDLGLRIYTRIAGGKDDVPKEAPGGTGQALGALSRQAVALAQAGRPADAVADWQRILSDDALRRGVLRDANRLPQSAALVAAEQIDRLLQAHGRALYAPTEEKARARLTAAKGDASALGRVADEYPNAVAADEALRQLARLHEEAGRWGAAARAYRRLLRCPVASDERQRLLLGLRRARERQRERLPSAEPLGLTPPLARAWEKDERLLGSADGPPAAEVFLVRGDVLVCREVATGTERWRRPTAGAPTWAGRHAECAVVAGPDAVRAFLASDGTPLWELPAPDAAAFTDPRLSAFQMAGGRFFCLQGECRLLALDAESGRALWQNWSPAARLGADVPGVRFSPHYLATDDRVLLQSAGRCRLLDARTGITVRELPTETILWAQPPLPLGNNRVAVVNGRQHVAALDLSSGKSIWSHALSAWSTLSGEPALLIGGGDALFIAVPRNYGYTLQRLDPRTGRPLWEDEAQLGPDRIEPGCFAVDGNGVYYSSRNVVTALSLDDGRTLWEEALPGPAGGWRLRQAGAALLAWPAEARRTKFHSRWLVSSLELQATFPPEDRAGRGIPLLLLDPAPRREAPQDERVLQRLNFVPPVPRAQGRLASDEELTAVPRLLIERAAADGPLVRLTREGLVVGWDGKAWALRTDK